MKNEIVLTKDQEEKRLKEFQKIAENWDALPEYAKGKLDGTISTIAVFCGNSELNTKNEKNDDLVAV